MAKYTFRLVVHTGNDEFWENIEKRGVSGCEEVKQLILDGLFSVGIDPHYEFSNDQLTLEKFEADAE